MERWGRTPRRCTASRARCESSAVFDLTPKFETCRHEIAQVIVEVSGELVSARAGRWSAGCTITWHTTLHVHSGSHIVIQENADLLKEGSFCFQLTYTIIIFGKLISTTFSYSVLRNLLDHIIRTKVYTRKFVQVHDHKVLNMFTGDAMSFGLEECELQNIYDLHITVPSRSRNDSDLLFDTSQYLSFGTNFILPG